MTTNVSYSRGGVLVGVLILVVGLILLLDQMGFVSANYLFRFFWPAVFICFGFQIGICRNNPGRVLVGVLMACFGVLLLFGAFGVLHVGIESMWPLLLIIWGVWVIGRAFGRDDVWRIKIRSGFRRKFQDATGVETPQEFAERLKSKIQNNIKSNIEDNIKSKMGGQTPTDLAERVKSKIEDDVRSNFANQTNSKSQTGWSPQSGNETIDSEFDYMAIFGGIKQRIAVKNFRGGRLMAICGGFEIDLTRAEIEGQSAVIDASALMGGGEIRVPDTWIIEIRGVALLGGYTDETHQMISDSATAKHLIVRGIAALGGVVIKN